MADMYDYSMLRTTTMSEAPLHVVGASCRLRQRTTRTFTTKCNSFFCCRQKILVVASLILSLVTTSSARGTARWQEHQTQYGATQKNTLREDLKRGHYQQDHHRTILQQERREASKENTRRRMATFQYYDNPQLHWMVSLENAVNLQEGNAIVPSPFDENVLYVTTSAGKILAISSLDGATIWDYTPPNKSVLLGDGDAWDTTCKSGVTFGEIDTLGKFLVYSVVDIPPEKNINGHQSRVIAISIPDHDVLWESTELPGVIQGTPVVNSNQNDPRRKFVLITRNTKLSKSDDTTQITGQITMLGVESGRVIWSESEGALGGGDDDVVTQGYGPLGIASSPYSGKFEGGSENTNDVVVWASSGDEGKAKSGFTFALQLPPFFHTSTNQVDALQSVRLKEVRWSAVARPVMTADGQELFFGVTGSQLRGWTGNNPFDATADWSAGLALNDNDPSAAIRTAPVLSRDESRLFVPSASTQMACLATKDGSTIWELLGTSPFVSEPKVSPRDDRVFFIQSADGRVFSLDQTSGKVLSLVSCDQYQEDCANSVVAEFALSSDGRFLYYGDVTGRVIALELGDFAETAPAPPPTGVYPLDPTNWVPNAQGQGGGEVKKGPTLAGSIALIVIAIFIGTGASIYIIIMNNLKTYPHPMQEPHAQVQDDAHPPPTDLANVPDPYEDAMIFKHPATEFSKCHPDDTNGYYYNEEGTFYGEESPEGGDDSFSHAPADRISQRLGTANLPLPILSRSEDYSYGASVLL